MLGVPIGIGDVRVCNPNCVWLGVQPSRPRRMNCTVSQAHRLTTRTTHVGSRRFSTTSSCQRCLRLSLVRGNGRRQLFRNAVEEAALPTEANPSANGVAKISTSEGSKSPLGPSPVGSTGVNFALYAPAAAGVTLCLFQEDGSPLMEVPVLTNSEGVWHVAVEGLAQSGVLYGFKVHGHGGWDTTYRWDDAKILLDPYAPLVKGRAVYGKRDEFEQFKQVDGSVFRGTFDFVSAPFDWGPDYKRPNLHLKDLVIYEVPIRTFTADPSSGVPEGHRGTYAAMTAKIPYLKELGVNCVEVLPVFEFDELEFQRIPNPRQHMVNIWGYSHLSFLAPMSRYGSDGQGPAAASRELKEMIKAFHDAGIEVILDVVYNHTVEGGDDAPYLLSWRGIDCPGYYMMDKNSFVQLMNYSGCGNTVNANAHAMKNLIIDSLRHWVLEYHFDGFRFDLAAALCRDGSGAILDCPPLIREISKDEVLSKVKLIAEPWDIGSYLLGRFPNWDIWGEWNGKYRDDVRRFMKGDPGMKPALATRIAGSADLYNVNNRKPYHSINFVIAHDGFTLYDLTAYNEKHNSDNGEQNRDGCNDNFSWNCGWEGETGDPNVNALRQRQMRNLHLVLMLSAGTPMVVSGDEYASTRYGNNNWYGHDTPLTWFNWNQMEQRKDGFWRFFSGLIKFRLSTPMLRREHFMGPEDITWHETMWDNFDSKFLAFTMHDRSDTNGSIYAAFNAHEFQVTVSLPPPPNGRKWCRIVDTNLEPPRDFTPDNTKPLGESYIVQPWSSIMMQAKRVSG